jgi:hypothetical protein
VLLHKHVNSRTAELELNSSCCVGVGRIAAMQDTLINLFHSFGLTLVSGFHASELVVFFLVAIGFLVMAAMGRDKHTEAALLDHEPHHRWHGWFARHR